jgi:hypothetical protein
VGLEQPAVLQGDLVATAPAVDQQGQVAFLESPLGQISQGELLRRELLSQLVQLGKYLLRDGKGGMLVIFSEADNARFIHDDDRPVGCSPALIPEAVGLDHLSRGMAVGEEGEGYVPQAGGPHLVGELAVGAYAQYLGILLCELAGSPAKRRGLGGSETGEIEDMKAEDKVFLALELAQGDPLPGVGR